MIRLRNGSSGVLIPIMALGILIKGLPLSHSLSRKIRRGLLDRFTFKMRLNGNTGVHGQNARCI